MFCILGDDAHFKYSVDEELPADTLSQQDSGR